MKILRVLTKNSIQPALDRFFAETSIYSLPYESILQKLRERGLLYPAGFKKNMERLGWEVLEVLPDHQLLQKKWLEENRKSVDFKATAWQKAVFKNQLEVFRPQVIYFERGGGFFVFEHSYRQQLKREFPFIKLVVGTWGTAGVDWKAYQDVDMMFSIDPGFDQNFKNGSVPSQVCYHCFDEEMLSYSSGLKSEDFIFVGVSGYGFSDHKERFFDLKWLLDNSPLKAWIFEPGPRSLKIALRNRLVRFLNFLPLEIVETLSRLFKQDHLLSRFIQTALHARTNHPDFWSLNYKPLRSLNPHQAFPPVFGHDYFRLLGKSKITLNRHIDAAVHYGNMRTFEVCGMGSCLLTDRGSKMKPIFEPDSEIVSYTSREECLEKVDYLLNHESVRKEIADRGQKRVLKEHTFSKRSLQIDETLRNLLVKTE